jgi:hypothetical protein
MTTQQYAVGVETAFAYNVGEDVVVRMAGVRAFDVERGRPVTAACVPDWTIGAVVARSDRESVPTYALRFDVHDAPCICLVDESAIEGVA